MTFCGQVETISVDRVYYSPLVEFLAEWLSEGCRGSVVFCVAIVGHIDWRWLTRVKRACL